MIIKHKTDKTQRLGATIAFSGVVKLMTKIHPYRSPEENYVFSFTIALVSRHEEFMTKATSENLISFK